MSWGNVSTLFGLCAKISGKCTLIRDKCRQKCGNTDTVTEEERGIVPKGLRKVLPTYKYLITQGKERRWHADS
jgi:hypothetical protein